MTAHQRFLETVVASMGCDPALLSQPGVTVKGRPDRAESHVTAGYAVGDHFVITCDPAVEQMLTDAVAASDMQPTFDAWAELANAQDGELLGGGMMHLLGESALPTVELPDGYTLRSLDREADAALIEALIAVSSEDDLDEAEIEMENLDEVIEVVVDASGAIASYSSTRDFDMAIGFGDIGIMTRPEHRGRDLASAAVVSLCHRILEAGNEPLYRCDTANTASRALCTSLGFTLATELTAYRFPV